MSRRSGNISLAVFLILAVVCAAEGFLHRKTDYLVTNCMQQSTLGSALSYYPHGYCYDNDIDNEKIHPEGYGLAMSAYSLSEAFKKKSARIYYDYPPNKYRVVAAFLPSFLLSFLTLKKAYLVVNIIVWALTSYAMWWLGLYIFGSEKIGMIAGLLCATSYAVIVLIGGIKSEVFQLTSYVLLVALSLRLDHYANDESPAALSNSFLLGLFGGICIFASVGTFYFASFLIAYGLLVTRFPVFIKRNLCFLAGCLIVYFLIASFIKQPASASMSHWVASHGFQLAKWWAAFKGRIVNHFALVVPSYLWIGALCGLFFLNKRELKLILSMLTIFAASEAVMIGANPYQFYTPIIYYLQILFPIYLLSARLLYFLLFETKSNINILLILAKRAAAAVFIIATLVTSNLWLLGNKYYYCSATSPIPIEVLRHSYFNFDNLYVYEDMADKELKK